MGRQVALIVGIGVMLVLGLFLVSAYSNQMGEQDAVPSADAPGAVQAPGADQIRDRTVAAELPPNLRRRVDALQSEAASAAGDSALETQRELVNLFIGFGRPGRAALAQGALAEEQQSFDGWRMAGNFFYDWMRTEEAVERRGIASMAVEAYEKALEINPDHLDVRTDLATAYLETNNPMRGVQLVKQVLAADPDHIQARFNYGIMLLRIQRLEEAIEQFEYVQNITEEGSQAYQQATELISLVREQMST